MMKMIYDGIVWDVFDKCSDEITLKNGSEYCILRVDTFSVDNAAEVARWNEDCESCRIHRKDDLP